MRRLGDSAVERNPQAFFFDTLAAVTQITETGDCELLQTPLKVGIQIWVSEREVDNPNDLETACVDAVQTHGPIPARRLRRCRSIAMAAQFFLLPNGCIRGACGLATRPLISRRKNGCLHRLGRGGAR
jgi:hypothetical protein